MSDRLPGGRTRLRRARRPRCLNTFGGSQRAVNMTTSAASKPRNYFATTHWTVVLDASRNETTRGHNALATLCETYWYPLYAYVRRQGHSPADAEDLTQGFF